MSTISKKIIFWASIKTKDTSRFICINWTHSVEANASFICKWTRVIDTIWRWCSWRFGFTSTTIRFGLALIEITNSISIFNFYCSFFKDFYSSTIRYIRFTSSSRSINNTFLLSKLCCRNTINPRRWIFRTIIFHPNTSGLFWIWWAHITKTNSFTISCCQSFSCYWTTVILTDNWHTTGIGAGISI